MCKWLFSFLLVSLLALDLGSAHATTLRDAIELAIKNNPRIKAAQSSRRAARHVLDQATGRFLPEISLNADFGSERIDRPNGFGPLVNDQWRNRRRATLTIRQILFDGWDRANDVYQSRARISAASLKILARSEAVALNVIEAYIDITRHERLISLARTNVVRHRKLLRSVRDRVRGGKNSQGDLNQTRERLQATIALVSQIKIARDTAAAKYKNAVGIAPRRLRSVRFPKNVYRSVEKAVRAAIDNNPRLGALRSEIDVAGFKTDQFRSSLYPLVTLEGSATRGEDLDGTPGRSNDMRGMVVLKWKLFDGGIRNSRVEELTEREFGKVEEYDTILRNLRQEIEIAWSHIHEGGRQVAAKRRQLRETNSVVAAYRREYEADKRSLLDVLDAENTRFGIEFDLSNTSAIRRFSAYQLVAHTGGLLTMFSVKKPAGSDIGPAKIGSSFKRALTRSFTIPSLRRD